MLETYYTELLRYFTRQAGNVHIAEDAVMEAYVRALQHLHEGHPIRQPRAFLYQSVRNLLISQSQRQATEARILETFSIISSQSVPTPEQQVSARQQMQRLMALLDGMPAKRRNAFILVRIHGMSYAEAAHYMDLSTEAIEKHIARALMDCAGYAMAD